MIKAAIFDLDGLLIDSEPIWNKAYTAFLSEYHVSDNPTISSQMMGMGLREAMILMQEKLGLKGELNELLAEYREIFYQILFTDQNLNLLPGAKDLIEKFYEEEKVLAVTTGGHTEIKMREILKRLGVDQYFKILVSSDDVKKGKPAPDVYLVAAGKLGLKPSECLALEDSINGVLAAKAAGMKTIAVYDRRFNKRENYPTADLVVGSLRQINLEMIKNLGE